MYAITPRFRYSSDLQCDADSCEWLPVGNIKHFPPERAGKNPILPSKNPSCFDASRHRHWFRNAKRSRKYSPAIKSRYTAMINCYGRRRGEGKQRQPEMQLNDVMRWINHRRRDVSFPVRSCERSARKRKRKGGGGGGGGGESRKKRGNINKFDITIETEAIITDPSRCPDKRNQIVPRRMASIGASETKIINE